MIGLVPILIAASAGFAGAADSVTQPATMPGVRAYHMSVWDGSATAYIFGGWNGGYDGSVVKFTPSTLTATTLAGAGFGTLSANGGSAVWAGGKAYVFGGYHAAFMNQVVKYDPSTNSAAAIGGVTVLPSARDNTAAVFDPHVTSSCPAGCAYIFGGETTGGRLTQILRFSPASVPPTITVMTAVLPSPRALMAAAWDPRDRPAAGCPNGCAYLFGGLDSSNTALSQIVRYNPTNNSVVTMSATLPTPVFSQSAAWIGNCGYVFGGQTQSGTRSSEITGYDPIVDKRYVRTPLPSGRDQTAAISDGTSAWVSGGSTTGTNQISAIVKFVPLPPCTPPRCTDEWVPTANTASGTGSWIGGGRGNQATGNDVAVSGGYGNWATGDRAAISGGKCNTVMADYGFVGGGIRNNVTGITATIGGGQSNVATGNGSVVGGGNTNAASGDTSTIGGGNQNEAAGDYAGVLGGLKNKASADRAAVVGGHLNTASAVEAFVGAGAHNEGKAQGAFVGAGSYNSAQAQDAAIAGGTSNVASGQGAFVGAGGANLASAVSSVVGGGVGNLATAANAGILAGAQNRATGNQAGVLAGEENAAGGIDSGIGSGQANAAAGNGAFVGAGGWNAASGQSGFIGAGEYNVEAGGYGVVGGGERNAILPSADDAVIGGGADNQATMPYSAVAGGRDAVTRSFGQNAQASAMFSQPGSAQHSTYVVLGASDVGTLRRPLWLDGPAGTQAMKVPIGATWEFHVYLSATDGQSSYGCELQGAIANRGGTTVLLPSLTPVAPTTGVPLVPCASVWSDVLAKTWLADAAAGPGGTLVIEVSQLPPLPPNTTTTFPGAHWVATVETTEVM